MTNVPHCTAGISGPKFTPSSTRVSAARFSVPVITRTWVEGVTSTPVTSVSVWTPFSEPCRPFWTQGPSSDSGPALATVPAPRKNTRAAITVLVLAMSSSTFQPWLSKGRTSPSIWTAFFKASSLESVVYAIGKKGAGVPAGASQTGTQLNKPAQIAQGADHQNRYRGPV